MGLIDFCLRTNACSASALASENDLSPTEAIAEEHSRRDAPNVSARFGLMLDATAASPDAPGPRAQVQLTPARWSAMVLINRTINHAIEATSDESQFGERERWSMPILEARRSSEIPRGDCEDYALEKRALLLNAGWPRDALALAVARLPQAGLHTVMIVQTDRGDFVLDNLHLLPQPSAALNYQWVSRQVGPELTHWGRARLALYSEPGR